MLRTLQTFLTNAPARPNPPPPEAMQAQRYYHGCPDESWARRIHAEGIQPNDVTLVRGLRRGDPRAPVRGRVYLTPNLAEAVRYALGDGADDAELDIARWERRVGRPGRRYGYVFAVEGSALREIEPDEDNVGVALRAASMLVVRGATPECALQDGDFSPAARLVAYDQDLAREVIDACRASMTPHQFASVAAGNVRQYAAAGKRALRLMAPTLRLRLAAAGDSFAHVGPIQPAAWWRVDRFMVDVLLRRPEAIFDRRGPSPFGTSAVFEGAEPQPPGLPVPR